jgi:hypothetical protein
MLTVRGLWLIGVLPVVYAHRMPPDGIGTRHGWKAGIATILAALLAVLASSHAGAQEVEIRRWNQLPVDQNFAVFSYARTSGEISTDPVLQIEDAAVDIDTFVLGYIRSFAVMGKMARFELRQAFQDGTWSGLLAGVPTEVTRNGMNDTVARVAVNLLGGPPLSGQAFADWRATVSEETILGVALAVSMPTGEYFDDKLINLGSNRFSLRPQIGFQHRDGPWVYEATGTAFLFGENDDFFGGQRRTQQPLFSLEGSIEYDFAPGVWLSAGAAIAAGGQSAINGMERNDERLDVGWLVSGGVPLTRALAFRASYIGSQHLNDFGLASHTISLGLQTTW